MFKGLSSLLFLYYTFFTLLLGLADIGLVTEAHTASTYVGTEGFIPPEGPNSPQGDVFSLGKTLYEILTGQDRNQFPALPASFANDGQADSNYVELIEIINHACHHDRTIRYASARAMHAEITALANGRSIRRLRLLERRMSFVSRFSKLAALFILPCLLNVIKLRKNPSKNGRMSCQEKQLALGYFLCNC